MEQMALNRRQVFIKLKEKTLRLGIQETERLLVGDDLPVRPPGAIPEAEFLMTCRRCGTCAWTCPRQAIRWEQDGRWRSWGTPVLYPVENPCDFCLQCVNACPSGALNYDGSTGKIGVAVLNRDLCLAWQGVICGLCRTACGKQGGIALVEGQKPVVQPGKCTGCGRCASRCVTLPNAIAIQAVERTILDQGENSHA